MSRFATFKGEEITVTFSSVGCWDDYGVPNSPTWWTPTEIEVESLSILDHEQDFETLSPKIQNEILSLTDNFTDSDWS
jgi:hypothetical protein